MSNDILPPNCYRVSVEGVGDFVFRRRNFRLQGQIELSTAQFRDVPNLMNVFTQFYDLLVLTVEAPEGWDQDDPDSFDPLDRDTCERLLLVWASLKAEEKKSEDKILRNASDMGLALCQTTGFLFRRRYNLPPNHPLFLDCPFEDMLIDVWAHAHKDDPKLRLTVVTEDYDEELQRMEEEARAENALTDADGEWETVAEDHFSG